MATYKWVLWDLAGTRLGEVNNAYDCSFKPRLNGLHTASFRVRLDNPLGTRIMDASDLDGAVLCGVYRDSTLEFIGDLTTAEEVGPGYRILLDREGMLNKAYSLPAADVISSQDLDSQTENGLLEGVVPNDLANVLLRRALMDAHVAARKQPRRIVTLEPFTDDTKPSISCNFANALFRLSKRLVAKATTEVAYNDERGDLITSLVTAANAEGDTGVRIGTIDTGYPTQVDGWSYKPLSEALTELAAAPTIPFETPSVYIQRDNFNAQSNGALTGKTPQTGTTWAHFTGISASTRQWSVFSNTGSGGGPGIVRGPFAPLDGGTWNVGHWIYADPTSLTNTLATVSYKVDNIYSLSPSGADLSVGVFARLDAGNGAVLATANWAQPTYPYFQLILMVWNGSAWIADPSSIQTQQMTWWIPDQFFTIRLGVNDAGEIVAWHYDPDSNPNGAPPIFTATRSECATGGLLETGLAGIYTRHNSTIGTIAADDFWVIDPTLPFTAEGIDFELAPSVPTADSNQSGVVGAGLKIATLNAPVRLGSDKTDPAFQRGDGASRLNNPSYGSEYVLGDSLPARLKAENTTRLNATVRVYGADISKDSEGKITEAPILVPES